MLDALNTSIELRGKAALPIENIFNGSKALGNFPCRQRRAECNPTRTAGDLIVTVLIRQHERFERDGTSVLLEQDINFAQATLGAEIEVPTLDGKVKLTIPEGTQSGTTFRIRGKGIPYVRGNGRGDQFVTVNIRTPKNLTSSQKELLRQFAASMGDLDGESGKSIFGKKKR